MRYATDLLSDPDVTDIITELFSEEHLDVFELINQSLPSEIAASVIQQPRSRVTTSSATDRRNRSSTSTVASSSSDATAPLNETLDAFGIAFVRLCSSLKKLHRNSFHATSSSSEADSFYSWCVLAKTALDCVAQRASAVIESAAQQWRVLRHTVAYTLISSERVRCPQCRCCATDGGRVIEKRISGSVLIHSLFFWLFVASEYAFQGRREALFQRRHG